MTTYRKVLSKWNMKESGDTFAPLFGLLQTHTFCAANLASRTQKNSKHIQITYETRNPYTGWITWCAKVGNRLLYPVIIRGGLVMNARVERL